MTKIAVSQRQEVVALYMGGMTQAEVAAVFYVDRITVRNILLSLGALGRGASKEAMEKVVALHLEKRAQVVQEKWNLSLADYDEHVAEYGSSGTPDSPMRRYVEHRAKAGTRGVKWEFDFASWWKVWQESGRWAERNRGNGFVMGRQNDGDTPYSPSTVYICTGGQNVRDGVANARIFNRDRGRNSLGGGKGYSKSEGNGPNPYTVQCSGKYVGSYPTAELARAAYLAAVEAYKRSLA